MASGTEPRGLKGSGERTLVTATIGSPPLTHRRLARSLFAVAGVTGAVLVALSGGYGYHRDELYFLVAGAHPAWGYPDQPPLTPLLAWATTSLLGDSLVALRLPSALAIAAVVVLAALLGREFSAQPGAQLLAAGCTAVSAYAIAVGHLLSTATFDLLAWTALSWLLARALRDGGPVWLAVGLVAGIGLENKTLLAFYLGALGVALVVFGPRTQLRSPWLWLAVVVALALWAPNLWWQATHDWPLLTVSRSIAAGGSATSAPRWLFLPYQLVLVSPLLVPVWGIGLWRLLRDPALRTFRLFGVAYLLLAILFLVTGGKPYYLASLYPVLLAAGVQPVLDWVRRGRVAVRVGMVTGALAVTAAFSVVLMLPVVPPTALARTPIPAVNTDAGATLGWPELVATVATVYRGLPPGERDQAVIVTANYGEAGALQQARSRLRLPPVFSGHMGFADWGPPPENATLTIAVGLDRTTLDGLFASVTPVAQIDNGIGVNNAERGRTVWICRAQRTPWSQAWPQLRYPR
jgi:4-amino-4-deoxy-L-arabinose transferase-like glycosyltransferase